MDGGRWPSRKVSLHFLSQAVGVSQGVKHGTTSFAILVLVSASGNCFSPSVIPERNHDAEPVLALVAAGSGRQDTGSAFFRGHLQVGVGL